MGKIYSKGDIVFLKNMKLIDYDGSSRLDNRINGHPFIVLNDIDEFGETVLCLKCSASEKGKRKGYHLIIENLKMKGIHNKLSYVDIVNVYKFEVNTVVVPVGKISNPKMREIMEKVKDKINI